MSTIKHILFPYDFSHHAAQVVPVVRAYAEKLGARLTLMSVVPPVWTPAPAGMGLHADDIKHQVAELKEHLDQALVAELSGLTVDRVADAGEPAFRITEFAEHHAVDLIIMPTHGLDSLRSVLGGSATAKVLHDAHAPVWTAAHLENPSASRLPRTIVCAVDGRGQTTTILRWADNFRRSVGASMKLLHVVGPISDWPSLQSEQALQDQVRNEARQAIESLRAAVGIDAPLTVAVGEVVKTVAEEVRQDGADLVIIGRGQLPSPFGRLRTHAYGIIQASPCPVVSI
jgi:nucleotide-binding universal stress UspA family protein